MAYLKISASTIVKAVAFFLSLPACGGSSTTSDDGADGETTSSTTQSSTTTSGEGTTTVGEGTADVTTTAGTTVGEGTTDTSTSTSATLGESSTEDGATTEGESSDDDATTSRGDSDESVSSSGSDDGTEVGDGTCDALASIFDEALSQARQCLAGGTVETHECDEGLTVEDLCGCLHAVSDQHPVAAGDALSARVAFQAQCPVPDRCALIDCVPASASGHCELTEHPDGVCQFD